MSKRNIFITTAIILVSLLGVFLAYSPVLADCGGAETSVINCSGEGEDAIFGILSMVIKWMTGAIGLVAVGAVVYGAILFGTSGDNPENVKKAREIWTNVVIGLVAFAFMVAILNFIIPGGAWQ